MGTLRRKRERAPPCTGTLFLHSWSRLVPQNGSPETTQTIYFKQFGMRFGCQACPGPNRGITTQDLPMLHGNAISSKKRTPRCMGALPPPRLCGPSGHGSAPAAEASWGFRVAPVARNFSYIFVPRYFGTSSYVLIQTKESNKSNEYQMFGTENL